MSKEKEFVIKSEQLDVLLCFINEPLRDEIKKELIEVERGDVTAYECDLCGMEYEWDKCSDGSYWKAAK